MNRFFLACSLFSILLLPAACKKQQNQDAAIRAAIVQHLSTVSGLNMDAMDMNITSVSVNGDAAQAEVDFHLKGSTSPDAGMKMQYNLQKQGSGWVVLKKQLGGSGAAASTPQNSIQSVHPSLPANPPKSN